MIRVGPDHDGTSLSARDTVGKVIKGWWDLGSFLVHVETDDREPIHSVMATEYRRDGRRRFGGVVVRNMGAQQMAEKSNRKKSNQRWSKELETKLRKKLAEYSKASGYEWLFDRLFPSELNDLTKRNAVVDLVDDHDPDNVPRLNANGDVIAPRGGMASMSLDQPPNLPPTEGPMDRMLNGTPPIDPINKRLMEQYPHRFR